MKYAFFALLNVHDKNLNFLYITCIYNLKRDRFFALYDIIHVQTLHHINDDVA